jgi:plasmid stabilization system protein ParE
MSLTDHDRIVDLTAAALLQSEALEAALASSFDGALDPRAHGTLRSRIKDRTRRRDIFSRDARADLETLIAIVAKLVDEGTTVRRWNEWPEGCSSDEPYEREHTTARPRRSASPTRYRN